MHSSVGLSRSPQEQPDSTLAVDLRLVAIGQRGDAAARFREAIVACEGIVDLLTITVAVTSSYVTYHYLALGKHVQYPVRTVFGLAFAFAIVMVLMLDRVGAYRRGNSLLPCPEVPRTCDRGLRP